ncbi:MAG: HesA/MoeB/ThiF family protein [Pseudomonadota bacterium]
MTPEALERYARHIVLPEIGSDGQSRLQDSRVLVVGCGGLGNGLLTYLAAGGVGHITVYDPDRVQRSDLARQFLFTPADLGAPKVAVAARRLRDMNPEIILEPIDAPWDGRTQNFGVIADATDDPATRLAIADAARAADVPMVSAAIIRFDGQLTTVTAKGPCYRCLHQDLIQSQGLSCAQAGVYGPAVGVMAAWQACEVGKALMQVGDDLTGRLLLIDLLGGRVRDIRYARRCSACLAQAVS